MIPEPLQFVAAAALLGVTAVLIFAYREYLVASSERRLSGMLERVGLDPALAWRKHGNAVARGLQIRCRSCPHEALCERWLNGDEPGDNAFCPNADVFQALRGGPPG